MEQDFTPEIQIRDEQFMNRFMKKNSSSKRERVLKNIILHSCLFLTFGEYDKGTMLKNAMPGFVKQIGSVVNPK